jgi:uncharacterized protein (TIGR03083 family)
MSQLSPEQYDAQTAASTAALAALVDAGELALPIPTCPEWTLRKLANHVGRAHRWAAQIAGTRSAEFIPFQSVPDGKMPDDPPGQGAWLTSGAQRLAAALTDAGDDEVWMFTGLAPAQFWRRRMCHETIVHAADGQLAAGQQPVVDPLVAADAIDEWLTVMSPLTSPREAALPQGATVHVHATDNGLDGAGEWLISHEAAGVSVASGHGTADVAVRGPATALLLVLLGRLPAADPAITVHGDTALLAGWLGATSF